MADRLGPSMGVRITEVSLIRRSIIERFHCITCASTVPAQHEQNKKLMRTTAIIVQGRRVGFEGG